MQLFTLFPTAPAIAPGEVKAKHLSSTSITVSWDPLPPNSHNGVITKYTVYYYKQHSPRISEQSIAVSVSNRQTGISNLSVYTDYNISVSASTSAGEGPRSSGIIVKTGEAGIS